MQEQQRLLEAFVAAARSGDLSALERLLAADVISYSDGGGVVRASRIPVLGRERVAKYICAFADREIEGPKGLIRANTDRLRLNGMNNGPDFSEVTYFLAADNRDDFFALIRDGVDRYGIDEESAEGWIESISNRPEDKSDFALGAGTSTGLQLTYDLRYDCSKGVQVIIVHLNPA
jgi:hypothetical protein